MRIQNNIAAMNSHRQLGATTTRGAQSMEKLSSGFRINRAGDDAAGLAISEKMRGQIRGLTQASRNAQDGISMIQTAEGALNETHNILQRMRELAVQSASDTNVEVDRGAIQNEINQLKSEIDRIGDTTEFNTQSLLKGDGKVNLDSTGIASTTGVTSGGATNHVQATQSLTMVDKSAADLDGNSLTVTLNGEALKINFVLDNTIGADSMSVRTDGATANEITIAVKGTAGDADAAATAVKSALTTMIGKNDVLKGNYVIDGTGAAVTMTAQTEANKGSFYGSKGNIALTSATGTGGLIAANVAASVGTTTFTQATHTLDFGTIDSLAKAEALIGQGFTVDGQAYEFYNANDGAYTGEARGVNISNVISATANWDEQLATAVAAQVKGDGFTAAVDAGNAEKVIFTATAEGTKGNSAVSFSDGGVQEDFKATFQIGANQAQTMDVKIGDMRSKALGVQDVDLSNSTSAQSAITTINNAIEKVSAQRSELGAFQNRLEYTIKNLDTSAENLQASESRIRDVDMAKEMMNFTKNNILQQAAQAMLAQANQAPQGVLQLLR